MFIEKSSIASSYNDSLALVLYQMLCDGCVVQTSRSVYLKDYL